MLEKDFFIFKKLFHILIKKGKKTKALNVFLKSLKNLKYNKDINLSYQDIISKSFYNVKPLLHIQKIRKSRKIFILPKVITTEQKINISMHWLIKSVNFRKEWKLKERLEREFLDCFLGKGSTIKKKQSVYKTILVSRPFLNLLIYK